MGERAFAERFGLPLNLDFLESASDSRVDFTLQSGYTVDVKTATRPYGLWVERGLPMADLFVLALYHAPNHADLVGWAWREDVLKAPVRQSRHGVWNHCLTVEELRGWPS